ncbi:MSF1-like conserved region family protein [Cryptosporidium serpentis]
MVLTSKSHTYHYNWETVTLAFWNKYPNDLQPHVRRVDVLNININETMRRMFMKRLHSLKYNVPGWIERLIGCTAQGYAVEESFCDLDSKVLKIKGVNHTFNQFFRLEEECRYEVHPENREWTLFTQESKFIVEGFGKKSNSIRKYIEKLAAQTAHEKSINGLSAMNEKIKSIEPFIDKKNTKSKLENKLDGILTVAQLNKKVMADSDIEITNYLFNKLDIEDKVGNENLHVDQQDYNEVIQRLYKESEGYKYLQSRPKDCSESYKNPIYISKMDNIHANIFFKPKNSGIYDKLLNKVQNRNHPLLIRKIYDATRFTVSLLQKINYIQSKTVYKDRCTVLDHFFNFLCS